jgi:hypothetical protein
VTTTTLRAARAAIQPGDTNRLHRTPGGAERIASLMVALADLPDVAYGPCSPVCDDEDGDVVATAAEVLARLRADAQRDPITWADAILADMASEVAR